MNILINHAVKAAGICVALAGALVACGGGGDDAAGSLTDFLIQPTATTFTAPASSASAPANTCVAGGTQDVYVYGGTAPYRIDNTSPAYVTVDRTSVDSRGGHFTVTVASAACFSKAVIVVVDKLDRQVLFTVDNAPNTGT